jgi:hypothetical protein
MAEEKKPLVGKGSMMIDERGHNKLLGYWKGDPPTSLTGYEGRAFSAFRESENLAQRLHEQNLAIYTAKATNRPPPETIPDAVVRQQLAKKDLQKLSEVKARLGKLDSELTARRHELKPYDWDNSVAAVMSRQEIRSHLRGLDDTKRREALRKFEYRQAALETLPELSGLTEAYHTAITEEQLRFRHGPAMAALDEAHQALQTAYTAHETATLAAENEIRAAGGQVREAPTPPPSKPFVE